MAPKPQTDKQPQSNPVEDRLQEENRKASTDRDVTTDTTKDPALLGGSTDSNAAADKAVAEKANQDEATERALTENPPGPMPDEVRRRLEEEEAKILQAQNEAELAGALTGAPPGGQVTDRIEQIGGDGQTRPWVTIAGRTLCIRQGDFDSVQVGVRTNPQSDAVQSLGQFDRDEFVALIEAAGFDQDDED